MAVSKKQDVKVSSEEYSLIELIKSFGEQIPPQEPGESKTDKQFCSIRDTIDDFLTNNEDGVIIDIGCGNAVLVEFLATDVNLQKHTDWGYIGIDFDSYRKPLFKIANEHGKASSVSFVEANSFNKSFPEVDHNKAVLYVCRNVFHELNIEKTSQLLHNVIASMKKSDKFLVQDLRTFHPLEENNCGWDPGIFCNFF